MGKIISKPYSVKGGDNFNRIFGRNKVNAEIKDIFISKRKCKELINAYEEYIDFLSEDYKNIFMIAHTHGFKCSKETIEKGRELRNIIKKLRERHGI